ncbi:Proteasome subunit alpha type-4 [Hanseniaspora vineae]
MSGYDRAISIFSPDGHIFQVDYAAEAVKRGTCCVGIKGADCVVLGCERRSTLKLQDPRITPSKISKIDNHVMLTFSGLNADSRILIDKARVEAQSHRLTLEDPVNIEYLARYIANVQQKYTQSGGVRPFGVSTLVAGFDPNDKTPKLYQTEPSGVYSAWFAQAIGRNSKTVREFLEKNYDKDSLPANESEAVLLTIKALLEVVQTGAKNIEIAVVKANNDITILSSKKIDELVTEIENEKTKEKTENENL